MRIQILFAAICLTFFAVPRLQADDNAAIRGWNVAQHASWGSDWLFADALRKASGFGTARPKDQLHELGRLDTTKSLDFPNDRGTIVVHTQEGNPVPPGDYVLTWTGSGSAKVRSMGAGSAREIASADNRVTYRLDNLVDKLQVQIDGDVRDPHLWLPNAEGQVWNPAALKSLEGAAVLRFMDWTQTNRACVKEWKQRPQVCSLYQGTFAGVAWEHCLDLANTVGAQPWLNIPVRADADYCRQLGKLLSKQLPAGQTVRIEFCGNEYWNSAPGFRDNHHRLLNLRYTPHPENNQGQRHPATAYAHLMTEQANALAETFPRERTIRVVSAHTSTSWWAKTTTAELALLGTDWDELACSFYFAGLHDIDAPELGLPSRGEEGKDIFFNIVMKQLQSGNQYKRVEANALIAEQHGKAISFYEGGSHARYYGQDESIKRWYVEVNRDARMAAAVAENSRQIRSRFPDSVQCYFSDSAFYDDDKVGVFGAIDGRNDQWNDDARNAKWKAFIEATR